MINNEQMMMIRMKKNKNTLKILKIYKQNPLKKNKKRKNKKLN